MLEIAAGILIAIAVLLALPFLVRSMPRLMGGFGIIMVMVLLSILVAN